MKLNAHLFRHFLSSFFHSHRSGWIHNGTRINVLHKFPNLFAQSTPSSSIQFFHNILNCIVIFSQFDSSFFGGFFFLNALQQKQSAWRSRSFSAVWVYPYVWHYLVEHPGSLLHIVCRVSSTFAAVHSHITHQYQVQIFEHCHALHTYYAAVVFDVDKANITQIRSIVNV